MMIGVKIKKLRRKNKVTQEQLAKYLNVTPQAVSKWKKIWLILKYIYSFLLLIIFR